MPLYTVADAPLCCLEVLLTGKADTPYRVKALFPQGFYPILTIVRLYSNNRSPILKRSFAYRQTIGLKFSRGSMGVAKGQQNLPILPPPLPPRYVILFQLLNHKRGSRGSKNLF